MTQLLIPLEYEIYRTKDDKKLFITLGYDENTLIYYYLYSFEEIDDVIVAGIDEEFLEYKKKEFVKNRGLKLIKRGEFKKWK